MIETLENSRIEFKVKLVDDLEETVIGFLNSKDGGIVYLGVNDKGKVIGLNNNMDLLQRKIKDRIISNIEPSVLGLFDLEVLEEEGKKYLKITIARGLEKPYHLKGMGMTSDSCFIRVGIKYNKNKFEYESFERTITIEGLTKVQESIIKLLLDRPNLTQPELARILGVGERKIRYNMKDLIDNSYIERIGSNKTGKWIVKKFK